MPPIDPATPSHSIDGDRLRATIARKGAELTQLGGVAGVEVLWQGVEPWPRPTALGATRGASKPPAAKGRGPFDPHSLGWLVRRACGRVAVPIA